jgi:hypothetical protein
LTTIIRIFIHPRLLQHNGDVSPKEYSSILFLTSALEGGEGSASRPGRTLPPGKTRYPLYRRLGGPQGRSGRVQKMSPPPGFDPLTVEPVGIRYTDWATRPLFLQVPHQTLCISLLPHTCHILCPPYFPWLFHPNNICCTVPTRKLCIMQFSPVSSSCNILRLCCGHSQFITLC